MLYAKNPFSLLNEAATDDFLDPDVSPEVKEDIQELQDDLSSNIEVVDAEDKETNNAVLTAESCPVWRLEESGRYCVDIRDIMRICEAEEEATGEPADAGDVASDVVANNDEVESKDDLVIVAPADVAQEIVEFALLEAKAGRSGKGAKKAKNLKNALKELKDKGFKIATKKKKGSKKKK